MRYVRTQGGRVAHRPSCPYARNALATPWNWAEGQTPREIAAAMLALGIRPVRFCKRCLADSGVSS